MDIFGRKKIRELEKKFDQLELLAEERIQSEMAKNNEMKAILESPAFKIAYEQAKQAEEKQKQYDALVGENLSYPIIRDLINSAQHGVQIKVLLKSGDSFTIEASDPYSKIVDRFRSESF